MKTGGGGSEIFVGLRKRFKFNGKCYAVVSAGKQVE